MAAFTGYGPLDALVLWELLRHAFGAPKLAAPGAASAPAAAPPPAAAPVATPTATTPAQAITTAAPAAAPAASVLPTGIPVTTQTPAQASTPGLPDFPAGWEPDSPPPKEVTARAWSLLPTLWKTGAGTHVQEQTNGRWITYQAQNMSGKKGVVAFRVKGSPKAA